LSRKKRSRCRVRNATYEGVGVWRNVFGESVARGLTVWDLRANWGMAFRFLPVGRDSYPDIGAGAATRQGILGMPILKILTLYP